MTPEDRRGQAKTLRETPLLWEILDYLEEGAVSLCVYAENDAERAENAHAVRAIRNLKDNIARAAEDPRARKQAPA